MNLPIAIVLSTLLLLRVSVAIIGRQRRIFFAKIPDEKDVYLVLDRISLRITADRNYLNLKAGRNNRVMGRLTLASGLMIVNTAQGVIFRTEQSDEVSLRIVGPGRLVLLGQNPAGEVSMRVEFASSQYNQIKTQFDKVFEG